MITILLGPPGSGKGTQAEMICKNYQLTQISTGDILREKMKGDTAEAEKIRKFMGTGKLFSDKLINKLVRKKFMELFELNGEFRLLFDGYPRTIEQADFLYRKLKKIGEKIDCVLVFELADKYIVDRISARRIDRKTGKVYNLISNPPKENEDVDLYQRIDDTAEVIQNRLEIYHSQTAPLIEYYDKFQLVEHIDASLELETVQQNIYNILDRYK